MLTSARELRQEREKQKEMVQQKTNLQAASQLLEQRISRLQAQLKDIQKAGIGTTPEGNTVVVVSTVRKMYWYVHESSVFASLHLCQWE